MASIGWPSSKMARFMFIFFETGRSIVHIKRSYLFNLKLMPLEARSEEFCFALALHRQMKQCHSYICTPLVNAGCNVRKPRMQTKCFARWFLRKSYNNDLSSPSTTISFCYHPRLDKINLSACLLLSITDVSALMAMLRKAVRLRSRSKRLHKKTDMPKLVNTISANKASKFDLL